jgi:putative Ca2+/H+ antiporter (TMEM165/GDT1 family)
MDFKTVWLAFGAVLVAELADKTQMVSMGMAAKSGKPGEVLVGSIAAYSLITVVSVAAGTLLSRFLKPELMRLVGGGIFVLIGILMLAKKI